MLVPFWSLQILFMLVYIALLALAIDILVSYENNDNEDWDDTQFDNLSDPQNVVHKALDYVVPVWMVLCVICLVLTITEIILLARHKLRPLAFLVMNIIKTAIWTPLFGLDVFSAIRAGERTATVVAILIEAVLLYVFLPSLLRTPH
jgi:hypothetical protein